MNSFVYLIVLSSLSLVFGQFPNTNEVCPPICVPFNLNVSVVSVSSTKLIRIDSLTFFPATRRNLVPAIVHSVFLRRRQQMRLHHQHTNRRKSVSLWEALAEQCVCEFYFLLALLQVFPFLRTNLLTVINGTSTVTSSGNTTNLLTARNLLSLTKLS